MICRKHQDSIYSCPCTVKEPAPTPRRIDETNTDIAANPLTSQVGGGHYKKLSIQPVEYIHANGLPFIEGSVIKYVTRWRDKGGLQDIDKAIHFLRLLKEMEGKGQPAVKG